MPVALTTNSAIERIAVVDSVPCKRLDSHRRMTISFFRAALSMFLLLALTVVSAGGQEQRRKVSDALELQCPPCERVHCSPRRPSQLRCRGGIVRGVCNCCPVCAKTEGETCGGHWNYLGRCDFGLYCENADYSAAMNQVIIGNAAPEAEMKVENRRVEKQKSLNAVWRSEGRCRRGQQMSDGPNPLFVCFPRCTPEFCSRKVKALCSAVDNAERKQSCQGDCQHTSCSACRYVQPAEADCSTAIRCTSPSDTRCLRRFGRCVRKQQCSRRHYPCTATNTREARLKFLCIVPECPFRQ